MIGRRHRGTAAAVGVVLTLGVLASGCASSSDSAAPSTSTPRSMSTTEPATESSTTAGPDPGPSGAPVGESVGCRTATPLAEGRTVVTLGAGSSARTYARYVPEGLDPAEPAPLVIDFTAYSPASMQEAFSGFTLPDDDGEVKADAVGAVVVTPEPVNGEGLLTWNIDDTDGWADDQQFVTDVLDDIEQDACIDTRRVLASGFAIGAVMASTVACRQPDRITVVATVSGLWDPPACSPSRPTPIVSFHGTDDHFLPFEGGVGDRVGQLGLSGATSSGLVAMASRPTALASSQAWAERNGCDADPTDEPVVDGVTRMVWADCTDGADVELYVIDGGAHTWPGSNGMAGYEALLGPVSDTVSATDLIWTFFTDHAPT